MVGPHDILVIDDDRELCALLDEYLGTEGYRVQAVHDGAAGLKRALEEEHDLVVLDVMLPSMNGFDVLRALRQRSSVPVLMLTARGQAVDRIVGLEMGADDYLQKPFDPRELTARIRAIQRRVTTTPASDVLRVDDVVFEAAALRVQVGGEEVELTTAERALLEALLRDAGRVVSREQLSKDVLGRRFSPLDRAIDVHVSNLRKKLGPGREGRARIRTVRGEGYLYVRERRE
ncbi:MAG: response regulator [Sandaracinaceae bacterium]